MRKGLLLRYYAIVADLVLLCFLAGQLLSAPLYPGSITRTARTYDTSAAEHPKEPAVQFPQVDPESVGLKPEILQVFSDKIQALLDEGEAVGAVLTIIKDRKIVLHKAFGWADRESERPMETDTICRMRSMTKPFVGTSILMLAEQNKLAIADKVAKYLPFFRNDKCRDITIGQLLTHTGGYDQPGYPNGPQAYSDLKALVEKIGEVGPTHEPGSRYNYSDAGSSTLAHIVSVVSDMPAEDFIRKNIIEPLGLKGTDCNMFKDNPLRPRVSSTYRRMQKVWIKYWVNTARQAVPYFRGSGGMYSTTLDYAKFMAMWMDMGQIGGTAGQGGAKRLLSPETVKQALTPSRLSRNGDEGYGFQWQIFRESDGVFGHGGSDGTLAIASPKDDLMLLCFTQSRGGPTVSEIRSLFFEVFF